MSFEKGQEPVDAPPPYPGTEHQTQPGGSYPMQNPAGQTNYGYQGQYSAPPGVQPQYPGQPNYGYGGNVVVTQVGGVGAPVYQTPPVDYTTQALIACLCCFWPTGLLALMKASESRDAVARGDMVTAHSAANSARQMVRISYIVGIVSMVFLAVILGVYFGVIWHNIYNNNY